MNAKIDPQYWVINGAPDGASAQNDTTRLSCSAVRTADTNIYQVHVDNVAKLFSGVTTLSLPTTVAPYSYTPSSLWAALAPNYAYTGDNFVFVNDVNGFSASNTLVVLEGDSQPNSPAFYSEWGQIGTFGHIPTVQNNPVKLSDTLAKVPFPSSVGNSTDSSSWISASAATPASAIQGVVTDWTWDYVQAIDTSAKTITLASLSPQTGAWAVGQQVVMPSGNYVGTISAVGTATPSAAAIPPGGGYATGGIIQPNVMVTQLTFADSYANDLWQGAPSVQPGLIPTLVIDDTATSGIKLFYTTSTITNYTIMAGVPLSTATLIVNGGGGITGATVSGGVPTYTVNTVSATNPIFSGEYITVLNVTGSGGTNLNFTNALVTAVGGSSGAWTFTLGVTGATLGTPNYSSGQVMGTIFPLGTTITGVYYDTALSKTAVATSQPAVRAKGDVGYATYFVPVFAAKVASDVSAGMTTTTANGAPGGGYQWLTNIPASSTTVSAGQGLYAWNTSASDQRGAGSVGTITSVAPGLVVNVSNPSVTGITATATSGTASLTLSSANQVVKGMIIHGTSIPQGSTVLTVNSVTEVITISANVTAALAGQSVGFETDGAYTTATISSSGTTRTMTFSSPGAGLKVGDSITLTTVSGATNWNASFVGTWTVATASTTAGTTTVTFTGSGSLSLGSTSFAGPVQGPRPSCYNKIVTSSGVTWLPTLGDAVTSGNLPAGTTVTWVNNNGNTGIVGGQYFLVSNAFISGSGSYILSDSTTTTNLTWVVTTAGQAVSWIDGAGGYNLGAQPIMTYTQSKAYQATITTPAGNTYGASINFPPFYSSVDPSPYGEGSSVGDTDDGPYGKTGSPWWFHPYYKTLMFPINITNWQSTPLATFVGMNGTTVTCDDNSKIAAYFAANPTTAFLTFRSEGALNGGASKWRVTGIPTGSTNTFTINATNSSSYAVQQNAYPNGDSQNNIYAWEVNTNASSTNYLDWIVPSASAISATSFNGTGPGVVTVQNGTIGGVHSAGTTVGSYLYGATAKRWIGTNTAADLEYLIVDQVGSRYSTTLYADVLGGVDTSFIVAPAPAQISATLTLKVTGGQAYLETIAGGGGGGVTGVYGPVSGVSKGMLVVGSGIPTGTVVTSVVAPTGSTVSGKIYVSNAPTDSFLTGESVTFTSNVMNLAADIAGDTSVAIVGSGTNQEAVLLSGAYQSLDGSVNNVPIVWTLASGSSFRFDHFAGEPVYTPNVLCYSNPLGNDHGVDTPVVGSPDISTTTSATASAALIAQNI